MDIIPAWDGQEDTLAQYILDVNDLASLSWNIWMTIPIYLVRKWTERAQNWWRIQTQEQKKLFRSSWHHLRRAICDTWMTPHWIATQKRIAAKRKYRWNQERPMDYIWEKYRLLRIGHPDYDPRTMAEELYQSIPDLWSFHLPDNALENPTRLLKALQKKEPIIKKLEKLANEDGSVKKNDQKSNYKIKKFHKTKVFLVSERKGKTNRKDKKKGKPKYRSKEGLSREGEPAYPWDPFESKNPPPQKCIYCHNPKHWDNDCRNAKIHMAKMMLLEAQDDPGELHYAKAFLAAQGLEVEEKEETEEESSDSEDSNSDSGSEAGEDSALED
ncbi:hypothetical protein CPB86DRAFT_820607 [Serendipita vermifera]|nr:hypothetical protein CPB86DRAFT_820694 [Serendipita vermifera]PVF91291.1 hypothetical protein CPB86DRAFT_820607 [Serendipita vermifera]